MKKFLVPLILGLSLIFLTGSSCAKKIDQPLVKRQVKITSSGFDPQNLTVEKDTVVTWTNADTAIHKIEFEGDFSVNSSGELDPMDSFVFSFSQTGTFKYFDNFKPEIKGEVVVK